VPTGELPLQGNKHILNLALHIEKVIGTEIASHIILLYMNVV
jgi:hypothetical protein